MKLRLLGGPVDDYRAIVIDTSDQWGERREVKMCWRCGNEFDLRHANAEEWICGECVAAMRGGQASLDAYIAAHPRHYQATARAEGR